MESATLVRQLKNDGYKLTNPRVQILKVLSASNNLLSAQEIVEILRRKKVKTDLVTTYRTLELFKDIGIAQQVQFEDKVSRYEIVKEDSHHHHLVCIKCGDIEELPLDESTFVKQIEAKSKFKVQRHCLEFYGFCKDCQ